MISISPFKAEVTLDEQRSEMEYLLRRADHEAVAASRATDPRASESHATLARHYGQQSRELIAKLDKRADMTASAPQP